MKIRKPSGDALLVMGGGSLMTYLAMLLTGSETWMADVMIVAAVVFILSGLYVGSGKSDGQTDA